MGNCDCPTTRAQLDDFLHNELCAEDAADIREHIAGCPECQGEHQVGVVLTQVIARACRESAPDDLRSHVLASIRQLQATHDVVPVDRV